MGASYFERACEMWRRYRRDGLRLVTAAHSAMLQTSSTPLPTLALTCGMCGELPSAAAVVTACRKLFCTGEGRTFLILNVAGSEDPRSHGFAHSTSGWSGLMP